MKCPRCNTDMVLYDQFYERDDDASWYNRRATNRLVSEYICKSCGKIEID